VSASSVTKTQVKSTPAAVTPGLGCFSLCSADAEVSELRRLGIIGHMAPAWQPVLQPNIGVTIDSRQQWRR